MIRLNLAAPDPCPSCGGQVEETYDGGRDCLIVFCDRERTALRGPELRLWWSEHAKNCHGCDGRDGPETWRCDFERESPQWLLDALSGVRPSRAAFELRVTPQR